MMLYYTKFTLRNLMKFEKNICTEYGVIELVCMFNYDYNNFLRIFSIWSSFSFACLLIMQCAKRNSAHAPQFACYFGLYYERFESLIFSKQIAVYYFSTFSQEKLSLFFFHHKLMKRKNEPYYEYLKPHSEHPPPPIIIFWSIRFGNIKRKSVVCVCAVSHFQLKIYASWFIILTKNISAAIQW